MTDRGVEGHGVNIAEEMRFQMRSLCWGDGVAEFNVVVYIYSEIVFVQS